MKGRILGTAMALALMLGSAKAAVLLDVPGMPALDGTVTVSAVWQGQEDGCDALVNLPADQLTIDMVADLNRFVYIRKNHPVRWYPEETQRAIEALIGKNPDVLHMTEFIRLHAADVTPVSDLHVRISLAVDYRPDQEIVVVLGDMSEPSNPVWTPIAAQVAQKGQVDVTIPRELMAGLSGKDVLLSLMLRRSVAYQTETKVDIAEVPVQPKARPSKQAEDSIRVVETVDLDGKPLPHHFALEVAPETAEIRQEITLLRQHVTLRGLPTLSWLPEENQRRVRYLLGADADTLIVSDYVPVIARDFRPTDGDAVGTFAFATPYREGQRIVTALGLPNGDAADQDGTRMRWAVQPALVRAEGVVDIVFNQLALINMNTQTGLLLMFSIPVAEQ